MTDKESTTGEKQPDHSGFVEHLKVIHFTLSLTCFIAIIAVAAKSVSSVQRAYDQSNLLLALQKKWDSGKWLDGVAGEKSLQDPAFEAKVEASGYPTLNLTFRPASLTGPRQWERYRWLAFAKKDKSGLVALKPHTGDSFTNIEDAETVWNMLSDFQYLVVPSQVHDGWLLRPKTNKEDNLVLEAKLNGGSPVDISTRTQRAAGDVAGTRWFLASDVEEYMAFEGEPWRTAALDLVKQRRADCYFVAILRDNRDNQRTFQAFLLLPAECKVERTDLVKRFGDPIIPAAFPLGDFKHSFPDAEELGKNLKTLKLNELRDFFQAEQDRAVDKVETPIVKLPAESIAYWGTITILLLSTYWFAVLRDFVLRAKSGDKAWDVPWIGTSSEVVSRGLFLATTLLPPSTAVYLVFVGLTHTFGWELRTLLAFIAFILVGVPMVGVISSWRKIHLKEQIRGAK